MCLYVDRAGGGGRSRLRFGERYRARRAGPAWEPRRESTNVGGCRQRPTCPYCAIILSMPRPLNERQSLERELAELPAQMVAYRHELENRPSISKARRERLEWEIRR